MPDYPCYSITPETWDRLRAIASKRDEKSAVASNTRVWNPQHNLLGLIGEAVFSVLCGMPMNESDEISDGGFDFPGIDCKATPHWSSPRLLRHADDPLKASVYFLAAVNLADRRVRPVGYATRAMIAEAPHVEYGHGPTRTLLEGSLLSADELIPRLFHPC
jgi:hypothetical protein